MSSPKGKRDIVRLRTFSADVDNVQEEKGLDAATVKEALPQEEGAASGGVLRKVSKKSLDLKDDSEQAKALDAEGITFDEETAKQVADQAYEETQSVQEGVGEVDQMVDGTTGENITPERAVTPPNPTDPEPAPPTPAPAPTPEVPAAPKPEIDTKSTDGKSADAFLAMMAEGKSAAPTEPAQGDATESAPVVVPQPEPIVIDNAETVDQIQPASESSMSDQGNVHEVTDDEVSGGSIVSDKKRERFKLFPAIGEAMSGWLTDTKDQIEEASREKHTVAKTSERTETIKAAAQAKTLAPDEDFGEVAARIQQTEKATVPDAPVMVKPKTVVQASWTHTISEDGEAVDEPTETEVPAKPRMSEAPTQLPVEKAPPAPAPPAEPAIAPEGADIRVIKDAKITAEDLQSLVTPEVAAPATPPAPKPAPIASPLPPIPAAPAAAATPAAVPAPPRRSLPSMAAVTLPSVGSGREWLPSPVLAVAVVFLAILAGVGTSLFFFWQPAAPSGTIATVSSQPLFTAQLQSNIAFDGSHSDIMQTMLSGINSNTGSLHLYFTRLDGQQAVSTSEVMDFLAPQAPGSFIRSVTNVSFGALDNRPFIVLRVNNFDSAFAGMLAWESTMSADLAPLFGPVVTESFDPQSRTTGQARGAFFKDVIASNLSSRLLTNERAEDRILYAFIDKQTVVITTDRLQLSNVLPLIR